MEENRIRKLVDDSKLSQAEFAARCGLDRSTLNLIYNGRRSPDVDSLKKIAAAFDCSVDWLLGLTKSEKADANIRAVCDFLHLSVNAISQLKTCTQREALDTILSDGQWCDILAELVVAQEYYLYGDGVNAEFSLYKASKAFTRLAELYVYAGGH